MIVKVSNIDDALLDEINGALKGDEPLTLLINSNGGDLNVAYAIYENLRNADKPIYAKVQGNCFSSATIILLGVKLENRTATKLSQFLIHSPILSANWGGINLTSAEQITDCLNEEYNRLLNVYKERLAVKDTNTINNLMRNEKTISAEHAYILGFISQVEEYKNEIDNKMNLLNKVLMKLLNESEGNIIKTENGEFTINGELVVGAKIDAPNGTYLEEKTQTKFVVEDGIVTDVEPQIKESEQPTEETEELEDKCKKEVKNEEEPIAEETTTEEVKEQVVEEVEKAVEEVAEETDAEKLAKVLESLGLRIAELEQKVLELSAPKEEPKEEPIAEEPKVENKVVRKYWGYSPLNSSVRNAVSKEELSRFWKR